MERRIRRLRRVLNCGFFVGRIAGLATKQSLLGRRRLTPRGCKRGEGLSGGMLSAWCRRPLTIGERRGISTSTMYARDFQLFIEHNDLLCRFEATRTPLEPPYTPTVIDSRKRTYKTRMINRDSYIQPDAPFLPFLRSHLDILLYTQDIGAPWKRDTTRLTVAS